MTQFIRFQQYRGSPGRLYGIRVVNIALQSSTTCPVEQGVKFTTNTPVIDEGIWDAIKYPERAPI